LIVLNCEIWFRQELVIFVFTLVMERCKKSKHDKKDELSVWAENGGEA
jgi:hypothetical protein